MSRNRHNHYNPIDPSQDQDQAQLQAELQAQLQAELQAQDQKQDQDQDQDQDQKQDQDQDQDQKQDQDQGQWQSSTNENSNENGNLNGNLNGNANLNANANYNENVSTTDVDVDVKVDVGMDHMSMPDDNDFGDLDMKDVSFDNIFMADDGSSISYDPGDDVNFEDIFNDAFGSGNNNSAFAVNQIADLVDNDALHGVTMDNSGDYTLTWEATGGEATAGDGIGGGGGAGTDSKFDHHGETDSAGWRIDAGDDIAASAAASAAAELTSNAFSQEIVLGANLQQNAVDVSIVGGDTHYTSVGGDDAEA